MPAGDARLVEVVGRHLDVDLVADGDAEEVLRILPEMCATTSWPFGSATRNMVPGSTCFTFPINSIGSSLATVRKMAGGECHSRPPKSISFRAKKAVDIRRQSAKFPGLYEM
jgi:hypothetical protein